MEKYTIIGKLISSILAKKNKKGALIKIQKIIGKKFFYESKIKKDWVISQSLYKMKLSKLTDLTKKIDEI
jgi:hypothetical protein